MINIIIGTHLVNEISALRKNNGAGGEQCRGSYKFKAGLHLSKNSKRELTMLLSVKREF